jgi:hypothetical protein
MGNIYKPSGWLNSIQYCIKFTIFQGEVSTHSKNIDQPIASDFILLVTLKTPLKTKGQPMPTWKSKAFNLLSLNLDDRTEIRDRNHSF